MKEGLRREVLYKRGGIREGEREELTNTIPDRPKRPAASKCLIDRVEEKRAQFTTFVAIREAAKAYRFEMASFLWRIN